MSAQPRRGERRILSYGERKMIEMRMRMNQGRLTGSLGIPGNKRIGSEGLSDHQMNRFARHMRDDLKEDEGLIRAQIQRDQRILEEGSATRLNRQQKERLERTVQEQKEWLRSRMCPKSIFHVKSDHPDYERAVRACMQEHDPAYNKVAVDFKNNMRRLDPDAPEKSNIENIRP